MKQILTLCYSIFLITTSFGQLTALTNNGDEVILNTDGTWKYLNRSPQNQNRIDTNKVKISKSAVSSFIVKSSKINCGIYIDPKKWSFAKGDDGEASEFEFTLKGKDAYAMIIAEKTEIPIETLKVIAIENAKAVAPDITITKEEYRKVNDNLVLLMQMNGSVKGIKLTYLAYYFSSPEGSVQLVTYSATNLFNAYKNDMEEFLNGFVSNRN